MLQVCFWQQFVNVCFQICKERKNICELKWKWLRYGQFESIRNFSTHTIVHIEYQIITLNYRIRDCLGIKHGLFLNDSMSSPQ